MHDDRRFDIPLSKAMKGALRVLANESGMTHLRDGIHSYNGETFYPTPLGWQQNIKFNYKDMHERLERQHRELKEMYDALQGEIKNLKRALNDTDGKTLHKVKGILEGRVSDEERMKQLRKYLNLKKEGA
jgi:hypothetical protein